jgi:hypothetical protein
MNKITVDMIDRVYSGKSNRCVCGCCGKYSDNDRAKKTVLNKILNQVGIIDVSSNYIALDTDTRTYVVYLKEEFVGKFA